MVVQCMIEVWSMMVNGGCGTYLTQLTHLDHILWVCNWEYVVLLRKMEFLELFKPSFKYSIIPLDLGSCRPAFWPASS